MGYTALTAFLEFKPDLDKAAQLAYAEIVQAYEENRLLGLLRQEAETVAALMEKADRVDGLERQVRNLEWNLARVKAAPAAIFTPDPAK